MREGGSLTPFQRGHPKLRSLSRRCPPRRRIFLRAMLGRVAGQVFDVMIHPQIRKFCLSSALRMNEADLLRGGAAAAHAVLTASAAKRLHGDPAPLADLATSGSLHPYLHSMLANTGQHGDSVALEAQHRRHLGATATLEHTRLIVGARRSTYLSSDRTVRNYRCTLGSHLVVIADRPHGTPEACPTVASHATSCPAARLRRIHVPTSWPAMHARCL